MDCMSPDLRDFIARARYDLERGWVAAALDALGRAQDLLGPEMQEPTP
jgi:hypothetical protein